MAFLAQSFSASLQKSATFDEPAHIAAGLSYVETGRVMLGPEHPPLLKELSGLALKSAGVHWPTSPQSAAALNGDRSAAASVARSIVVDNGPDRVTFWSRLPAIVIATGIVFGAFMFGRRLAGDLAGVGAAFLCAFDPNLLAHSFLVTTDAALATCLLFFIVALWDYVHTPTPTRGIVAGILLGAALGTKYSAVILPPLAALMILAALRWPPDASVIAAKRNDRKREQVTQNGRARLRRYLVGYLTICGVAFLVLQIIYLFPANPLQYVKGWGGIYGGHTEGFQGYMAGRLAPRFYSYYVVAFLLKEPLATIAVTAIGLGIVLFGKAISPLARTFFLLPPAVLVAGYTVMSFDIGIRYLLPALPFAHALGGVALARAINATSVARRTAAAALAAWVVVAAIGIYPDHLSYFNEAACVLSEPRKVGLDGGSQCGPTWLDDSNVDWGQGLKQLKLWLDRNAPGQHIRLGYFGSVPPEAYGIAYSPMSDAELLNGGTPGLYAVSAHIIASTPAVAKQMRGSGAEWLRRTPPVAVVGHAYYIFDLRDRGSSP